MNNHNDDTHIYVYIFLDSIYVHQMCVCTVHSSEAKHMGDEFLDFLLPNVFNNNI